MIVGSNGVSSHPVSNCCCCIRNPVFIVGVELDGEFIHSVDSDCDDSRRLPLYSEFQGLT